MAKIALVANKDWNLYNFRMPLARALRERGHEVVLICPFGQFIPKLREAGFRCMNWPVRRRSINPLTEILSILRLASIYRREKPDIVHHFTIKPILYGSIAARLAGVRRVINTFTGLGFLFSESSRAGLLRLAVLPLFRRALRGFWLVAHNEGNLRRLREAGLVNPWHATVIPGSGVDLKCFKPGERRGSAEPMVLMACRLLWDKGVGEFVRAARFLKSKGIRARFVIVGERDPDNPKCIPEAVLREWKEEGVVEFLGYREDVSDLLKEADVAVLPSYHEGVPKFLLEAAATGLPIVATNVEGCKAVVEDGENGMLVPARDWRALAGALEELLKDEAKRARMGRASRKKAEEFSEEKIVAKFLRLYEKVLGE